LTLEEHIVTAQMNLCGLARRAQLLQMPVAQFSLFVLLIADGLGVCDSFGHRGGSARRCFTGIHFVLRSCHVITLPLKGISGTG
jgi:hypothetical protein